MIWELKVIVLIAGLSQAMVGTAEFPTEEECLIAKDEEIALIMQNVKAGTYRIKEAGCTLNIKDYPSA